MKLTNIDTSNERLDKYILKKCPDISRSQIKKSIDNKKVLVNSKPEKAGFEVKIGDTIEIEFETPTQINANPENIPLNIVYEDKSCIVINKPQGMVTHPAIGSSNGTLVNALNYYTKNLSNIGGEFRLGIVHRLDKDTSGLLVVAKTNSAHINLQEQIQTKKCHRIYRAIVVGHLNTTSGTVNKNLRRSKKYPTKIETCGYNEGRSAITHYRVLEYLKGHTYVEFVLDTGRTHQIRVHSKFLGHPVLNDLTYGTKNAKISNFPQFLHAYKLEFVSPDTKKIVSVTAPLSNEFERVLKILQQN